jgi:hypothetical protein
MQFIYFFRAMKEIIRDYIKRSKKSIQKFKTSFIFFSEARFSELYLNFFSKRSELLIKLESFENFK